MGANLALDYIDYVCKIKPIPIIIRLNPAILAIVRGSLKKITPTVTITTKPNAVKGYATERGNLLNARI